MDRVTTKTSSKKTNKIVVKDPKKLSIVLSIIFILIVIIIIILLLNSKVDIQNVEDYSKLNSSKYSEELLLQYEKKESKEKFLEDYDLIQDAIGLYIINNVTLEEGSLGNVIATLKKELKKDEWQIFEISKPTFWNGNFDVSDEGIVTFKFANKNIEPSWINDDELINKIVIN